MPTTRIVNEEYFTVKDSYYRVANHLEPVYEETVEVISDGEKVTRKYLKTCMEGGFLFHKNDVATYKKKGKWGFSLHSFDDQPSRISNDGKTFCWHRDGFEHRSLTNGPQTINSNGILVWDDLDVPGSRKIDYPDNFEHDCHYHGRMPKYFFGLIDRLPKCCQAAWNE